MLQDAPRGSGIGWCGPLPHLTKGSFVGGFQLGAIRPTSGARACLDERPMGEPAFRRPVGSGVGAVEDRAQDVQRSVRTGSAARIQVLPAVREDEPDVRTVR